MFSTKIARHIRYNFHFRRTKRYRSDNFVVRRLQSPEEIRDVMSERVAAGGWRPGALDHVSFFAADNTGFFVGELDGKAISCMAVVKHSRNYAHLGNYIVDEPYRGSGYGHLTYKAALESIDESCISGGDAVVEKLNMYLTDVQVKPSWCEQRYDLVASEVVESLKQCRHPPPSITLQSPSLDIFPAVFEYDTRIHVFPRRSFLKEWIFAPNCHASIALNDDGKVLGYAVVRTTLREEEGWRIGPVFARNSLIAQSLYYDVCEKVCAENPRACIAVDVPYGNKFSSETIGLVNKMGGRPSFKCIRIYKNGEPQNMPLTEVFGITSIEIG